MGSSPLVFDRKRLRDSPWLIGVDEAGRGALAGPVVAGAVAVARDVLRSRKLQKLAAEVRDSKELPREIREAVFAGLEAAARSGVLFFGVGEASVEEIERVNILGATKLAMARAVEALALPDRLPTFDEVPGPLFEIAASPPPRILVDGLPLKGFPYQHEAVVKGDGCSFVIGLASIAAKVSRDRLMRQLAEVHPGYGFEAHVGYGTRRHRTALRDSGPLAIHRKLFLRKVLEDPASPLEGADVFEDPEAAALTGAE